MASARRREARTVPLGSLILEQRLRAPRREARLPGRPEGLAPPGLAERELLEDGAVDDNDQSGGDKPGEPEDRDGIWDGARLGAKRRCRLRRSAARMAIRH